MSNRLVFLPGLIALAIWQTASPCNAYADAPRPELTGTVTDATGNPLAGVRVDISTAAPKVGRGIFCPSCYLDCGKWTNTNEAGEFKIANLDETLKFRLVIAFPGFKTEQTELIDPESGSVDIRLSTLPTDVDPNRFVRGVITSEQGVAIPGALVSPYGAKTSQRRWWGRVDGVDPTVTDAEGKFALIVPDGFLSLDIEITADGYSGKLVFEMTPGDEPAAIEVPTGARVIGKLTRNGVPVGNMSIAVAQTNRSVGPDRGIFVAAVGAVTDWEGNFEFNYLPADQQYCIYSVAGDAKRTDSDYVLTVKTFNAPVSRQTRDLGTLEVTDPISIRGRVERVDGEPLPAGLKLSFGRKPAWDLVAFPVAEDGSFHASGLPPETYEIRIGDRDWVVVPESINYQVTSERSFGIYAAESVDNLVIPVKKGQ